MILDTSRFKLLFKWIALLCAFCALGLSVADAATLSITTMSRSGFDMEAIATAADAAKTDKWLNTGAEFLAIKNAGGSPITLTLTFGVGGIIDGVVPTSKTVSVTNGHTLLVGPFPPSVYNDANGYMIVSYSAVTSVTVAVVKPGS
jgi:hypothetical protein